MNQFTKRQIHFDILRITATAAVMILHISGQHLRQSGFTSAEWHFFNFYNSIVRWAVPIFTMISGALFLSRNDCIEKLFKKNIFRIFTAFCFWSLVYAIFAYFTGTSLVLSVKRFFTGNFHLWFLFMIAGLYMMVPFLKKIAEHDRLMKYFFVLAIIFNFFLPQLQTVLSLSFTEAGNILRAILSSAHINFVLGYTFYFLLGYYLNSIHINQKEFSVIKIVGIIGFLYTILMSEITAKSCGQPSTIFYDNFTLNVLLESVFVFLLFKKHFQHITFSKKTSHILFQLSAYSFGAYLIHAMIIDLLDLCFHLNTLTFYPALSTPIIFIIVFLLSFAISALLNKLPFLKKYIV